MKSSSTHPTDEPTVDSDGRKSDDDIITAGIVERNLVTDDTLRKALGSLLDTGCPGWWDSAKDVSGGIRGLPWVVLMELDLPGVAGIEAIALLKRRFPEIQTIILSTDPDPARIAEALKAGASGYLIKPTLASLLGSLAIAAPFDADRMILVKASKVIEMFHRQTPPRDTRNERLISLTRRETEVARLISEGLSTKEIASHLNLAVETARTHTRNIFRKLEIHTRTEVAVRYLKSRPEWNSKKD